MEIKDLSQYSPLYTLDTGAEIAKGRNNLYSIYTDKIQAVAEVTYSRLCEALGISHLNAEYGVGFRHMPDFVSISDYSNKWLNYSQWENKRHLLPELINPTDRAMHFVLNILTQQVYIFINEGYVTQDGYFIKANNGGAFFSRTLSQSLRQKTDVIRIKPCSFKAFTDLTSGYEDGYVVLERMANISEEAIKQCVEIPDCDIKQKITDYFTGKIVLAQELSQNYLRQKNRGKE